MGLLKQQIIKNKKLILGHIAAWILFFLYDNLYNILFINELIGQNRLKVELVYSFAEISASIFTFYTLLVCWKLYFVNKRKAAFLGIGVIFSISIFLSYQGMRLLVYLKLGDDFAGEEYWRLLILGTMQFFIPFLLYALAYVFAMSNITKQREINVLQEDNLRAETNSRDKEIKNILLQNAFLRAQINPHFLYNTLNFFLRSGFALFR